MNYLSITEPFTHEIEIKKSRFICYLFPIQNVDETNEYLAQLRKEHYKASHCCYAYILNDNANIQKMSDDGEPSGTAGVPMLEVLKQRNLTYILAVVVRYFGGTKLGTGGLIRAYGQAVSDALNSTQIMQNVSQIIGQITLSYAQVDSFNHYLNQLTLPITIMNTEYQAQVIIDFSIHAEFINDFERLLVERFNGQIDIKQFGEKTVNIPYLN